MHVFYKIFIVTASVDIHIVLVPKSSVFTMQHILRWALAVRRRVYILRTTCLGQFILIYEWEFNNINILYWCNYMQEEVRQIISHTNYIVFLVLFTVLSY